MWIDFQNDNEWGFGTEWQIGTTQVFAQTKPQLFASIMYKIYTLKQKYKNIDLSLNKHRHKTHLNKGWHLKHPKAETTTA